MKSNKLTSILNTFTKKEISDFVRFVSSPYFNTDKQVQLLCEIIKKSYPGIEKKLEDKKKIFSTIYPGKKYNDSMMRNILSRTMSQVAAFLTQNYITNNRLFMEVTKMRAIGDRGQRFLFKKSKSAVMNALNDYTKKDSNYFYMKMLYEDEIRRFTHREKSIVFPEEDNIQNIADNVIYFMSTELLRLYAVMINRDKHLIESKFELRFLNTLMEYFENNTEFFADIYYAHLYYSSIKLFLTEEEKYFGNVHKIVRDKYDSFPDVDRKNAYVVLINYCAEKINKGRLEYMQTKLELYKEIVDKKAHYEGLKYISHVFYDRVSFAAINMGETAWAKQFMEKYKNELEEEHREDTYRLALTEYYLKLEDYDRVIGCLSKVKRNDPLYKGETYILLLKIYYAAGFYDSFYSEIESYRNYLKKNRLVSKRRKELGLNFIHLIKKLCNAKQKKDLNEEFDTFLLKKEIIDNQYITDKFWLLDKLKNLEDN